LNKERKSKMKKTNWLAVTLIGVIAIFVLFWIGTMIGGGYGGYGMMGGNRGYGMMGNWGFSPFGWFGMGIGMLFMWLFPIGVLVLVVFGVASLARNNGGPIPPATQRPCPHCGKSTQADWQNCPYCGTSLK
jgi:zinc-ribbon domain